MKKLTKEDRGAIVRGLLSKEPTINAIAVMVVGDYLDCLENTIILLKRGFQNISEDTTDDNIRLIADAGVIVCEETLYEDVTI